MTEKPFDDRRVISAPGKEKGKDQSALPPPDPTNRRLRQVIPVMFPKAKNDGA